MGELSTFTVIPPSRLMLGRRRIYSKDNYCDARNVRRILAEAIPIHAANADEIRYLWNYYRGNQPALYRTKEVRPEICNRIVENHAQECVNFKIGYQLSDPVQYISRAGQDNEEDSEQIKNLNDLMFAEDKASSDHDLFEWECICGVGYRIVLPDEPYDWEVGTAPFKMHVLEPMNTFVVYSPEYDHRPLCGVYITKDTEGQPIYSVYTPVEFFKVVGDVIVEQRVHILGSIPIIEYDLNNARMGVFESVLPILDAMNAIESNRLDGIEQTVQSLMKFVNCDVTQDDFVAMLQLGAVKVTAVDGMQGDVEILHNDLDQGQTQVTKDDLYQAFVNITGMPNRSSGSASSDTGAAVLLRDGWTLAESHAKSYELQFKKAERDFLRVVLKICSAAKNENIHLRVRDIDIAFNRRNYDNILTKSQVLTTMLATEKIHPLLAFQACGLFTDPEAAYLMSVEYLAEHEQEPQLDDGTVALAMESAAGQPELNV